MADSNNTKNATHDPKRTVAIYGSIASENKEDRTVEIEFGPGVNLVVKTDDVEQIEEYADPMTGIPVAKIVLREGVDAKADLRPKSFTNAHARGAVPFAFGGTTQLPESASLPLTPFGPPAGTVQPNRFPNPEIPLPGRDPFPNPFPPFPNPGGQPFPIPGGTIPGDPGVMSGVQCMYATYTRSNRHFFGWIVDDGYGAGDIKYD